MVFAENPNKTCRTCRWFEKGECTNSDVPFVKNFDSGNFSVNVHPFVENGFLSESIEEGFPTLSLGERHYKGDLTYSNLKDILNIIPNLPKKWGRKILEAVKLDHEENLPIISDAISESVFTALQNYDFDIEEFEEFDSFREFSCCYWN